MDLSSWHFIYWSSIKNLGPSILEDFRGIINTALMLICSIIWTMQTWTQLYWIKPSGYYVPIALDIVVAYNLFSSIPMCKDMDPVVWFGPSAMRNKRGLPWVSFLTQMWIYKIWLPCSCSIWNRSYLNDWFCLGFHKSMDSKLANHSLPFPQPPSPQIKMGKKIYSCFKLQIWK